MPERGTYVDLVTLKRAMGEATTASDASLLAAAEAASRYLDGECHRRFYTQTATRYFTARHSHSLDVPDLLSVTTLKCDQDGDRTYEEVWASSDYDLTAGDDYNGWPKWRLVTTPNGSYSFSRYPRGVEIAGVWGYGDGESASPWLASGVNVTAASPTATTLTASDPQTPFSAGQTLLIESEQVYLTGVVGSVLTAERGVNGTTAAAHAARAASIARYPTGIARAALMLAEQMTRLEGAPFGVTGSPEMGVQTLTRDQQVFVLRVFGEYRLVTVG